MANTSFHRSPISPMMGLSDSFFKVSPQNTSTTSSDNSFEYLKQLKVQRLSDFYRSFSPNHHAMVSPNISPIISNLRNLAITEEPEKEDCEQEHAEKGKAPVGEGGLKVVAEQQNQPSTPLNSIYVVVPNKFCSGDSQKKTGGINEEKKRMLARELRLKRRTMFQVTQTPPSRPQIMLNSTNLDHTLGMATILTELGMERYIGLFIKEEINIPVFLTLTNEDLEVIGITNPEDKKKILKGVQTYKFLQ